MSTPCSLNILVADKRKYTTVYVIGRVFTVLPARARQTLFAGEVSILAQIAGTTGDMSLAATDCTRVEHGPGWKNVTRGFTP